MAHGIDLTDSLGVDVDLGDDAVDMALPEIYLKQIRSIECGTDAALAATVRLACDDRDDVVLGVADVVSR